jgi:hypothetical protein
VTGLPVAEESADSLPSESFGNVEHTHKANDDTVGYANLLVELSHRVSVTVAQHLEAWALVHADSGCGRPDLPAGQPRNH